MELFAHPNTKNIIFDLGGVLLNLNSQNTVNAFKKIGVSNFDELYSQAKQIRLFDDFEIGAITSTQFRDGIRALSGKNLPDEDIDFAWNAMLMDLPEERLKMLDKLWYNYRLFLLSNTNEIHIAAYSQYLQKTFGFPSLSHLFEKEYFSYKIAKRKPDAETFEYVLKENNLLAKETLFIDDSLQHTQGASNCGIQAVWLDLAGGKTVLDIFQLQKQTVEA